MSDEDKKDKSKLPLDEIFDSVFNHPTVKALTQVIKDKLTEGLDEFFSKGVKKEQKKD